MELNIGAAIEGRDRQTATAPSPAQLPVTCSILDAEALTTFVEHAYPIDQPLSCELLLPSMNDNYLINAADQRYILRVSRAGWRSADDIGYELSLLMHLSAKHVRVARPIAARDGRLYRALTAPEGTRYVTLFSHAEGEPLVWDHLDQCHAGGRLLAQLHNRSDDFIATSPRAYLDVVHLVDRPAAMLRPFVAHREDDGVYLSRLAERLRTWLDACAGQLEWGVCHGDFGGGNIFVSEAGPTAFDFDLCGAGWRAFDLASIRLKATSKRGSHIWNAFISGYQEERPLSPADMEATSLFCPVHRLWRLGLQASHTKQWGVLRVSDPVLDRELEFFRSWESSFQATL